MSYTTALARIKAIVEGVTDIGPVHDYLRWWNTDSEFLDLFQTTISGQKQIRGWTITREAIPEDTEDTQDDYATVHLFVIRGYLGLQDQTASEKALQALADLVRKALRSDRKLNGTIYDARPPTVTEFGHRSFGNVTCNYCEIHLRATMSEE